MSLRGLEAYLLYGRTSSESLIFRGGRLMQPYCVEQWAKCEQEWLRYIELNQLQYRLETLHGQADALRSESVERLDEGELEAVRDKQIDLREKDVKARVVKYFMKCDEIILQHTRFGRRINRVGAPPKFIGGPRYMYQRFLDAMGIVRETGAPSLFITTTCNPRWPEIKENLRRGQTASDRPEVFMQKLKELNKDLDEGLLGIQTAMVHVVEYQKRSLPHAHILLILRPEDKPISAEGVDKLVSTELPDKEKHPELYAT
ncbi:Helitron helicase-like protein [Phytophthora palmivora]|uniref:Helitron helicase-like protein n=1 Tax=Phytophthora palmivora TaxID=4796 RepID=A0A2P4WWM8_9STRA|nr:Helitron helicase-like protein [Phytophthora palmivora]